MGIIQSTNNKRASPGRTFTDYQNGSAFAVIKQDGSVIIWGSSSSGGDSSSVASELSSGVVDFPNIYANYGLINDYIDGQDGIDTVTF